MGAPPGGASPGGRNNALPRLGPARADGRGGASGGPPRARSRGAGRVRGAASGRGRRRLPLRPGRGRSAAGSLLAPSAGGRARALARGRHRPVRLDRLRLGRPRPRRPGHLRDPRRHLHARGDPGGGRRPPGSAARARRDRGGADAARHLPRGAQLGLRRPLHLGAAPGLRGRRGAGRLRRRGPRARPRGDPRRRLQPRRARRGGPRRLRPLLHRPPRHALGPRDELRRRRLRRRARVGLPERPHVAERVPHGRAAAGRRARDLRHGGAAPPGRVGRPGAGGIAAAGAADRRERPQRPPHPPAPGDRRVRHRRPVVRRLPPLAARPPHGRARRLLRRLRLGGGPRDGHAPALRVRRPLLPLPAAAARRARR